MKKYLLTGICVLYVLIPLSAQTVKNKFTIAISDNRNVQNQAFNYTLTTDSLHITGLADYGKSTIDYLHRALTAEEKKELNNFMQKFPVDKFNEVYFKDYANLGYITPEHYPRVIDMEITNLGKSKKIRVNNCYVAKFAALFALLNPMLPDEVKIIYKAEDLGK